MPPISTGKPILAKLENDDRISDDCLKSIHYTIDEGLNMKWWAIKLFDSWGHFPSGFMEGTGTLTAISGLKYFESGRGVPFGLYMFGRLFRGTLTAISGLKYFESGRGVPFGLYMFGRLFRVVPVYLITIAFNILFAYLGSGPAYKYYYSEQIINCDRNLWKNLIFIITESVMCIIDLVYIG
ncbi:unnamed protein product [Oppiella nova]|uniref:Nose resistant-to-fluoxetine protein N-terminal domain-containing protein n=1 Tax=Oppiella nova TaxID=334625 RepID=A0A7R9L9Q2_9ACAR|nr:unnamed protein product [Oppiella nova]CAG2160705.1 unnamed protein product [Oppiella nova]